MKILAIETSGQVAGCALVEDDRLIADFNMQNQKTHSQSLMPMVETMLNLSGEELSSVDAIAITKGPGSFTGLRIGAATVKGLGLALKKPLLPVPTVDAIAYNLFGTKGLICPLMDARRNQVYTGIYKENSNGETVAPRVPQLQEVIKEQCVVTVSEITEELNRTAYQTGEPVIFLGDGVPVYYEQLREQMKAPFTCAPLHLGKQRAASTAMLAMATYLVQGDECLVSADDFRPEYLRLSQAERERAEGIDTSLTRKR